MPSLPFTLRQLEVFANLASTTSFRASAQALGISQASVSNQIKALEEQLGVRLFARTPGRAPRLTGEGRAFADDLASFDRAAATLAAHRRREPLANAPARFRLLVGQGMFDGYVRAKLDLFLADHPLIELEFETPPPSNTLARSVTAGQFDFALINQRADIPHDPVLQRLARVRGGVYGHRQFAGGAQLPLANAEVAKLPFLLPPVGSRQEREVLRALADCGVEPTRIVGHSQYYDVMAAMLERGLAVASLSDAVLPPAMRDTVVQLMPLADWCLMFYRKPYLADPRADEVGDFLISALLDDPGYPAVETYDQSNTR